MDATGTTARPSARWLAAAATVVLIAAVAGVWLWRSPTHPAALAVTGDTSAAPSAGSGPAASSAVPLASSYFVTVDRGASGRGDTVELRDRSDGQVVKRLLTTSEGQTATASWSADGSILIGISSTDGGCRSRIEREDPSTGRLSLVRTIPEAMSQSAASPDGTELAYVTYPSCADASPPSCRTVCAGPEQFLPNVLGILDLTTGVIRHSATDSPGHPLVGLSWSPDGRQLAVGTYEDPAGVRIVDAGAPDLASAPSIPSAAGCYFSSPAWTTAGIVAVHTCSSPDGPSDSPGFAPDKLVRVSPGGAVTASWALPACIDGAQAATDPTHTTVLVQVDVGYGSGTCGVSWSTRISSVDRTRLVPVLTQAEPFGEGASWGLTSS